MEKLTVKGGVVCDANFFVCILPIIPRFLQLCQLNSTGHFIAELVKDTSLRRPGNVS